MYQKEIKIRYSEIGPDGRLGLAGILDYFQDASTFQSEQLGIGIEYLQKIRRAWLLAAWDVEIDRYPRFDERLTVFTIPYAFRGFYGFRNFGLLDEDGTMIVRADSTWFWFDSEKGIPARLGDDIRQAYPLEEKIPMEYGSRKIQAPEDGKEMEPFAVRRYNLDTNGHVNNVQYVAMAMEYVPDTFEVGKMRAEYRKAAVYGDQICPFVTEQDGKIIVRLCSEANEPYAVMEFSGRRGHD